MDDLKDSGAVQKTVLVGVTGCVAAYKSADIVRGLQKAGIRVKVVMTKHACEFVGPATFRALTREPVAVDLFDAPADPIYHISLAQEADLFLIAPATANVIAKVACGIADDLLTTTALAAKCPLVVAPAMNVQMYEAAPTRNNLGILHARGVTIIEAEEGYLACGDIGKGRLAETDTIIGAVLEMLGGKRDLEGRRVLVTAGPTVEDIDPVRYITNRSSGKMGYALAQEAARRGAEVTLVSGPVNLAPPEGVRLVSVRSAQDMMKEAEGYFSQADIALFSAAVSDMRPEKVAGQKLKKGMADSELSNITLVQNPDILATLAKGKGEGQVVVGFAAETADVLENARRKLASKNADLIVANEVGDNRVFGSDHNHASFVTGEGIEELPPMSKAGLAHLIIDKACSLLDI